MKALISIWQFKGLIAAKARQELKTRFSRSGIGSLWLILNPVAVIGTYLFVFSSIMQAKIPGVEDTLSYGIYLSAGVIFWISFSNTLVGLTQVFLSEKNLLKQAHLPKVLLPIFVVVSETINLLAYLAVFLAFIVAARRVPGAVALYLIPLVAVQYVFVIGLGVILGTLNAFFRDIGHSLGIVLHFWFWLTPIVYPVEILPAWARNFVQTYNPMTPIIEGYHAVLVTHSIPDFSGVFVVFCIAIALFPLGFFLFRRTAGTIADLV